MITKPILLDETGQQMLSAMNRQNALLEIMAADKIAELTTNLDEIHRLVREGIAQEVLAVGDQINVNWSDGTTNYVVPLDIVHFGDVQLQDGETVPGMFLQWHYCTPFGIQFDNYEAIYKAAEGLAAGTYNFTLSETYSAAEAGTYQFTLTEDVPAGGIIAGLRALADNGIIGNTVKTYASNSATTEIETATVSAGNDGTSLGSFTKSVPGTLNCAQRFGYGYGRWSQSAYRQWLNSAAAAGSWWAPQNDFDTPPTELATKRGFMAGFDDEFLAILGKVKVRTALNTVEGLSDTYEDTYDTFFLPSLEQMYGTPQLADAEGPYWEYWKRALGLTSPALTGSSNKYDAYKTYAIEARTSAQYVRLRSASRGNANVAWLVSSTGFLGSFHAYNSLRCAPACVVC